MNLIEMIRNGIGSDVVSSLSRKAGVSEDQAKSGISAGIPAVLAGILKNGAAGNTGLLSKMLSGVTNTGADGRPEDVLNNDQDSLLEKGKSLLGGLFGNDTDAVTGSVASSTGLSMSKASGLLAMVVPLITGYISKLMSSKGWSVPDLLGKIFENKSDITAALPQGLSSSLGLANVRMPGMSMPNVDVPKVDLPKAPYVNYETARASGMGFLKWLIPVLVIGIGIWWLAAKGCNSPKVNESVDSLTHNVDSVGSDVDSVVGAMGTGMEDTGAAVAGKINEAGDFVRDLGTTVTKKLPDGTEIKIGENSVENRLIAFIEDTNKPVDKSTWFTFDRLYFETGKSTLKAESNEQLRNIAAILKAYPAVHLKMGGYTDNTGDAALNLKISRERANTAMNELVKLGVDAKRLTAEGYGMEHPVATNETPEGRAQNRRIDIRVTEK